MISAGFEITKVNIPVMMRRTQKHGESRDYGVSKCILVVRVMFCLCTTQYLALGLTILTPYIM